MGKGMLGVGSEDENRREKEMKNVMGKKTMINNVRSPPPKKR